MFACLSVFRQRCSTPNVPSAYLQTDSPQHAPRNGKCDTSRSWNDVYRSCKLKPLAFASSTRWGPGKNAMKPAYFSAEVCELV